MEEKNGGKGKDGEGRVGIGRVGMGRVGESTSRGWKGGEGLCRSKNSFKKP